jgi:putative heme-binding domain-containing protein
MADILLAILRPNAAINPNFLAYEVTLRDGRELSGMVRGENAGGLTVVQAGGLTETVLRRDMESIRALDDSLMPEGLEAGLPPQDMVDLVAWLRGGAPGLFGSAGEEAMRRARADYRRRAPRGLERVLRSEEILPYPSWLGRWPMAYCRQRSGATALEWSANAPDSAVPDRRYLFEFPAAMGFLSEPEGSFELRLNGWPALQFGVVLDDHSWSSPDDTLRMRYAVKERNGEDSNGLLLLEVLGSRLTEGQEAVFEVVGSNSNSQRWFGVYLVDHESAVKPSTSGRCVASFRQMM